MSLFPHICLRKKNKLSAPCLGHLCLSGRQSAPFPGAFTLVELLIAVSIFSVVSIAIYSTFNSGASILRRVKNIELAQQMTLLKTERFARELREQPSSKKLLFGGTKDKISFPANLNYAPCRLTYYFDSFLGSLMRVADNLSEIIDPDGKINTEFKSKPVVFLSKLKEVKFSYLYLDLKKNEYKWAEEWQESILPIGVKFTIISESKEHVQTVFLPTA